MLLAGFLKWFQMVLRCFKQVLRSFLMLSARRSWRTKRLSRQVCFGTGGFKPRAELASQVCSCPGLGSWP